MPVEWERTYKEAFEEADAEKVPEICDRARRAIDDRLVELGAWSTAEKERERLREALRKLLLYEYQRRPPK